MANALAPTLWVPSGTWSLSLEEQFYLLWPAVFRRALPRFGARRLAVILVGVAVAISLVRIGITPAMPRAGYHLVRGDDIVLGCAAALVGWRPRRMVALVGAAGMLLAAVVLPPIAGGLSVVSVAAVCVVAGASHLPGLTWRPLVHVGRISYALYLWSSMLGEPLRIAFGDGGRMGPVTLAVWLAASFTAAEASTWLVERPARRWITGSRLVAAVPTPARSTAAAAAVLTSR